jgi:hypothetical protein
MKFIAFVVYASEIKKILAHLELPLNRSKSTQRQVICEKRDC